MVLFGAEGGGVCGVRELVGVCGKGYVAAVGDEDGRTR